MRPFRELLLPFAAALPLAACAKQQAVRPEAPLAATPAVAPAAPAPVAAAPRVEAAGASLDEVVRQTVLHFGFDDATLTQESQGRLRKLAEVLLREGTAAVRIAGHCDERGTVEYNLALGQRRAAAARKYLVDLGVPERAVDTVSFGAERPVSQAHDEAAWAQNRRAEAEPLQR